VKAIITIGVSAVMLVVSGCTESLDLADQNVRGYGDAVHTNMHAQIINPDPMKGNGLNDGNRRSLMIQRYQADKVEQPREDETSRVGVK
jgi:type IV pilus biogenesis protein CpaD/CtpE